MWTIWRLVSSMVVLGLLMFPAHSALSASGIAGVWATFDEDGTQTGFIRLLDRNGQVAGVIEAGMPGDDPNDRCTECPGQLKNHPLIGLPIISASREPGENTVRGKILDPNSGQYYNLRMRLLGDGQHLEIRGCLLYTSDAADE